MLNSKTGRGGGDVAAARADRIADDDTLEILQVLKVFAVRPLRSGISADAADGRIKVSVFSQDSAFCCKLARNAAACAT